ncbi:MAG: DNA-directed RNA polymerase subunit beta [bacterium]|nr:DNA-directed RNA polymerase subunit beta [bacterium]
MPIENKRVDFSKIQDALDIPNLIEMQKDSYEWFIQSKVPPDKRKNQGLEEAFQEVFPITDFNNNLVLEYIGYTLGKPRYSEQECRERGTTYAAPLWGKFRLIYKETGEVREQEIYMRDIPLMTEKGTFIINGAERVVVSQIHRSPGIFFDYDKNTRSFIGKIISYKGPWIEFEIDRSNVIYCHIARKRKLPVTCLLRALGYSKTEDILSLFFKKREVSVKTEGNKLLGFRIADSVKGENGIIVSAGKKITKEILDLINKAEVETIEVLGRELVPGASLILTTLEREDTKSQNEALIKIYNNIRPGEPSTFENAKASFERLFFDPKRYNLSRTGRYKINQKLKIDVPMDTLTLTKTDIVEAVKYLIRLKEGIGEIDDIDSLGNRRVRSVGELLQNSVRVGLARLERVIRERMTIQDPETITPQTVMNIKPFTAVINEFFGSSQLSQFMDQTNPLAELTHKRRLSALGIGGLSKERAGFEARDVHFTHYGRICPIETPEGPNIGLIVSMGIYGRVNEFGFIETPYRKVKDGVVTDKIEYLTADEEKKYGICQAITPTDKNGRLLEKRIFARLGEDYPLLPPEKISYMDVSPKQLISISTSLIPFLEHDDANRALMGSNMQRQAVPLLSPEAPIVGTGVERKVAENSGAAITSNISGIVTKVSGSEIVITDSEGKEHQYKLLKFKRSNQNTCINQKPIVRVGEHVKPGDLLSDGPAISQGELALGRNILVAFMPWEGYNFEDAILISEKLVKEDILTSIHIEKFEVEARDTQLGPEMITRDIPNVGEEALKNLDEQGIVRIGAEVKPGDILVGKVTPKGETDLTPEYKLLHSIFGEKAREVRDTSLRIPYGNQGIVIDVKVFSSTHDELPPGVEKRVEVLVANKRKITVGDKVAGRHGNKGVIAKILPEEDMPYLPDGTPVEMVLDSLSVPSRMNIGQILETHLGWAAKELGIKVITPVFTGVKESEIKDLLEKAGLPRDGKVELFDGRTGEKFDQKITVGYLYMMKLAHLVEDKVHARSTGPYSLVTQQPLGGKAQFGGQRLGEMEVWALEAYGASHTLQELLTVKSDDIIGRAKVYESIVKGEIAKTPGIPESFNVLAHELQGLSLDVRILDKNGNSIDLKELEERRRIRDKIGIENVFLRKKKEDKKTD